MLIRYIRDRKNRKVGVVVAIDADRVGWSMCHTTAGDKFDREKGLTIAIGRAEHRPVSIINVLSKEIPASIRMELLSMLERAGRYFQGVTV
jgi:hypothetical protein